MQEEITEETISEVEAEKVILARTCLAIARQIKDSYPDAHETPDETLGAALFTLSEAGLIVFPTEGEGEDVRIVGIQLKDPPDVREDR